MGEPDPRSSPSPPLSYLFHISFHMAIAHTPILIIVNKFLNLEAFNLVAILQTNFDAKLLSTFTAELKF